MSAHVTSLETSEGCGTVQRGVCTCGWVGPWQGTLAYPVACVRDIDYHLTRTGAAS